MNHIIYINDFLALVQNKSFVEASKVQCVTQPAFSRRIKMLEESLGTPLFNRNTHPVSLTSAGGIFLKHAQDLRDSVNLAYQDIQQHISVLENPIKISTSHTLAISCLPNALHELAPKEAIPLKLGVKHIDKCLADLTQGKADFALIHAHKDMPLYFESEFDIICIGTDKLISVISPSCKHPENMLAYTAETQLKKYIDITSGDNFNLTQNTIFESASSEVLKSFCLSGHGTAIIPQSLIKRELKAAELILCKEYNIQILLKIEFLRLKSQRRNPHKEKLWQKAKLLNMKI